MHRYTNTIIIDFNICTDYCSLPSHEGDCGSRLSLTVKFYYDSAMDMCAEFIYLGCGGNNNRFDSFEECETVCVFGNK